MQATPEGTDSARGRSSPGRAQAYVQSAGLALHEEWKPRGVYVTVWPPGPTDTPMLAKFGLDAKTMPMKVLKVGQVVTEGLNALSANRPLVIPDRMNRIMRSVLPASLTRSILAWCSAIFAWGSNRTTSTRKERHYEEFSDISRWMHTVQHLCHSSCSGK